MAPPQSGYLSTEICIELEFGNVAFEESRKPEYPEKTSQSREENQQQTQPTHAYMPTLPDNPGVSRIQNESLYLPYG